MAPHGSITKARVKYIKRKELQQYNNTTIESQNNDRHHHHHHHHHHQSSSPNNLPVDVHPGAWSHPHLIA
jgi:hypothetical protein